MGRVPLRLRIPVAKYTGYAQGAIELVRRLREDKRLVLEILAAHNSVPDYVAQDIKDMIVPVPRLKWLGVLFGFPPGLGSLQTQYKIIYTMYETDDVPEAWRSPVSKADEVWVPSTHCANTFGKYNRRIRIIPFGYDEKLFKRIVGRPRNQRGTFQFGSVGVMSKRKGVDLLVRAFVAAFPNKDDVTLTIKTRDTRWLPEVNDDRISIVDDDWERERLAEFYHDIDCLVQPSRGEGICALPDTMIRTGSGKKKIASIRNGENVITHNGHLKKVLCTTNRSYTGAVFGIKPFYSQHADFYTPEHPILTMQFTRKRKKTPMFLRGQYELTWTQAKDLVVNKHYVTVPRYVPTEEINEVNLYEHASDNAMMHEGLMVSNGRNQHGAKFVHPTAKRFHPKLELTEDVMRLIGLYIAEGSSTRTEVQFAFDSRDASLIDFVSRTMNTTWNLTGSLIINSRHRAALMFQCGTLAGVFRSLFGAGAVNKKIPEVLLSTPQHLLLALLRGLWEGDGCVGEEYSYSTVSPLLSQQVAELLFRLGVLGTVRMRSKANKRYQKIIGKVYRVRDEYNVRLKGPYADELFSKIGAGRDVSKKNRTFNHYFRDCQYFYVPVRDITMREYDGCVYNLHVDDDETYCGQFVVHNCMPPLEAAACGTPVITTNWSGPADYIDDNGIYGLNIRGMVRSENMLTKNAMWAEPDIVHLVALMKQAYNRELSVNGNYKQFTIGNMATLFTKAIIDTWRSMKK